MNNSQYAPGSSADGKTRLWPPAWLIRRRWLLERLTVADGASYDELVRAVASEFPQGGRIKTSILAARTVRGLLWAELAVTEPDESVWLTPAGWKAADALAEKAGVP